MARITELISNGATPAQMATEAVKIVADWDRLAHVEAFRDNIRAVVTEMEGMMPAIRDMELTGSVLPVMVQGVPSGGIHMALGGIVDVVRARIVGLEAAADALTGC